MVLPLQSLPSAASRYLRNAPDGNLGNAMFYMNDHSARKGEPVTTGILGQSFVAESHGCGLFCWVYSNSSSAFHWSSSCSSSQPQTDGDPKYDLLANREYLAVAYDRTNQQATAICTKAHPDWKTCHCELTETSVKCSNAPPASKSKK